LGMAPLEPLARASSVAETGDRSVMEMSGLGPTGNGT
jgi:hypothetical protein